MPILYHGTSSANATAMGTSPGTINVAKGSGELGCGFYTQESKSNAYRRGFTIYGNNGAVLQLDIIDKDYNVLDFQHLSLNQVQILNAKLRANGNQGTHKTKHDVIERPLVMQPRIRQQKFQSTTAENLLNGPNTTRTILP